MKRLIHYKQVDEPQECSDNIHCLKNKTGKKSYLTKFNMDSWFREKKICSKLKIRKKFLPLDKEDLQKSMLSHIRVKIMKLPA